MFLLLIVLAAFVARAEKSLEEQETYCVEMRNTYRILPGQDFGTLPQPLHSSYLSAKCYRFFCEPNKRAGHGKFKCTPLPKYQHLDGIAKNSSV